MMEPFTTLTSIAAPLEAANIDTDIILPARFLTTTEKSGLGRHAFAEWREAGNFALDRPEYDGARILVAGANFGCGSSREHAAWALADLGIRCIVAPSFGEIFRANALRNGMLPITLGEPAWRRMLSAAQVRSKIEVDLAAGTLRIDSGDPIPFALPEAERIALLNGWDEIDGIRARYGAEIARFEARQQVASPWLWQREQRHG